MFSLVDVYPIPSIRVGASIYEQSNHLEMTVLSGDDKDRETAPLSETDKKVNTH